MKVRAYVRVAKNTRGARTPYKVDASPTAKAHPLAQGAGVYERPLHTVHFALDIELPDGIFDPKEWPVVEVVVPPETVERIAVEVPAELVLEAPAEPAP